VAVHQISPDWMSTEEPRQWPCTAKGTGLGAEQCGATPASVWRRFCANGHSREVRMCGSHAALAAAGMVACTECIDKGTHCLAQLVPVDLVLLGHIGG
jgi:hypothetical protein